MASEINAMLNVTSEVHNQSAQNFNPEDGCFDQDTAAVRTARVFAYGLIFVASALGNAMTIAVVWRNKTMRKPFNYFIVNMAAADLIVTLVYMPRVVIMWLRGSEWLVIGPAGTVLCKLVPFLHGTSILASILTLLAISVDRFAAIVFPLKQKTFSLRKSRFVVVFIWVLAIAVRFPYMYSLGLKEIKNEFVCGANIEEAFGNNEAREIYYTFLLVTFYALPFIVILTSYAAIIVVLRRYKAPCDKEMCKLVKESRGKASRKVFYMMVTVTAAYLCCWLTYFLAQIVFDNVPCSLRFWRLFLAHSNSALNPCLYAMFNEKFREGYRKLLCWPCQRIRQGGDIFTENTLRKRRENLLHETIITDAAQNERRTLRTASKHEKHCDVVLHETNM